MLCISSPKYFLYEWSVTTEKLNCDGMSLTNNTITLKLLLKESDESLNAFPLQN